MFGLGMGEVLIIMVLALIFIGPKKLPGLARSLGKGMSEFQNALRGVSDSVKEIKEETTQEVSHDHQHSDVALSEPSDHHDNASDEANTKTEGKSS